MQKITPFLWFDNQAEEAINFYVSIFKNSKIVSMSRWSEGSPFPAGLLMTATFILDGQEFMALNAGPQFKFTEAVSFFINCETQAEIDEIWGKLTSDGGEPSQCGWLKDKYGLSWQVIPTALNELMSAPDGRGSRVMAALMQMSKIDIEILRQA